MKRKALSDDPKERKRAIMMYDCLKLKKFVKDVILTTGLCEESCEIFADSLVFADMRGVSSHGVTRLGVYYRRLTNGRVDPKAVFEIVSERPAMMLIDGHNGMGAPLGMFAMRKCMEKAKNAGNCFAAVCGGNHFGCAGYYTIAAAKEGMIGFAIADSNAIVAPTGSRQPMLGTNPYSIAVPAYGKEPFVLDMATSVVANGKIKLALKEGRPIPEGWGMDAEGHVTTDPSKVKFLMPFGGYKGYGISMAIDLLAGVLSGASTSRNMGSFWNTEDVREQRTGFFLGCFDPAAITDPERFMKDVSAYIDEMKAAEKAEGVDEILVAGEPEQRKYEKALKDGVKLSDIVAGELAKVGEQAGVAFDCAL